MEDFKVRARVHQGSALSPYLFSVVMDEVTKEIKREVPWCMLFSDNIALVGENREEVNQRLDVWRLALEGKGLRISRSRTRYIKYEFDKRK